MKLDADLIHGFAGSVLTNNFDNAVATPAFHRELWSLCASDHKQVAIAAPRGHAKSTAVTYVYALAAALFRNKEYIMLVSDTESQSVQFLYDIKRTLTENEDIQQLFGLADIIKDTETHCLFEFDDGKRFRFLSKGSGQAVRGIKIDNKRPDLILGDDLENDEIVLNPERRDKFRRWFFGALLPCLSDKGQIRIVGTILHMDALLERLMPRANKAKNIELITDPLREYTLVDNPQWKSVRYRAHSPDYKHILWQERFDEQRLRDIRQDYVDQGMPEVYAQEYLNYPIDESTAFFRKADFVTMPKDRANRPRRRYAAIDFAITEKEKADYTVIAVVEVDDNGVIDVIDIRRGRWDGREIIDEMFSVQKRYSPDIFTAESGMIEKALGPFMTEYMRSSGIYINLNPMVPTKDKMSRASSMQARMRAGSVRFDKDADWYTALEEEMCRFPRAAHDDQVDALSWIGLTLDKVVYAPTEEEMEEDEYFENYGASIYGRGRSVYCGY